MFIPLRRTGLLFEVEKKDVYGDRVYKTQGSSFGWAPIYMRENLGSSTVRADSSASRGRADERQADTRIIMDKFSQPKKGDMITLDGNEPLIINKVHERMDIVGRLHHWEVECGTVKQPTS